MIEVLIISRKISQASFDPKIKRLQNSIHMEFLHVFCPNKFKRRCHFLSDLSINLSFDIFSTNFMDVISPTRFVNHPSFMDYNNYLNNPFVLIIPDKKNLEGKL